MTTFSPARRLAMALDPVVKMRYAGIRPDPWQETVLRTQAKRVIILASRQAGKSSSIGGRALWTAETQARAEIVIGAPKQDQAAELLRKAMEVYNLAGHWDESQVDDEAIQRVTLTNGSRMSAVPGRAATVRSFSAVTLLVLDEAAYIPDDFYQAVFPMLAVSQGSVALLSTPHGKSGAFYDIWQNAPAWDPRLPDEAQLEAWLKIKVPWWDCPRIQPAFIDAERRRFGDAYVRREYCCEFMDADSAAFREEDIVALPSRAVESWAL